MDIAKRFHQNPLLKPSDLQPGIEGMEITCFLNPGVFRFDGKTWLLLRVAERPVQKQGVISFPVYNKEGKIEVLSFDENDPELDASDPRDRICGTELSDYHVLSPVGIERGRHPF